MIALHSPYALLETGLRMCPPEKSQDSDLIRCRAVRSLQVRMRGGGRGIRTPGTLSGTAVFKTACFNHSHIPPGLVSGIPILVYTRPFLNAGAHQVRKHLLDETKRPGMKLHDLGEVSQEIIQAVVTRIKMILVLHALFLQFLVQRRGPFLETVVVIPTAVKIDRELSHACGILLGKNK